MKTQKIISKHCGTAAKGTNTGNWNSRRTEKDIGEMFEPIMTKNFPQFLLETKL
jgi:hypothetical protein